MYRFHEFFPITEENKRNKEFMLEMVKQNGYFLMYASDDLKDDFDLVKAAINNDAFSLRYASKRFLEDKKIVLEAIQKCGSLYPNLDLKLRSDFDILFYALDSYNLALYYTSEELKDNFIICKKAASKYGMSIANISHRLRDNKEIIYTATKNIPYSFFYASYELKNNKDFVISCINLNSNIYNYIGNTLKLDNDIIELIIRKDASKMTKAPKEVLENKKYLFKIIERYISFFVTKTKR